MKIVLIFLVMLTSTYSLSLEKIKANLSKNTIDSNINFTMRTTILVNGTAMKSVTSYMQSGQSKMRMEISNSMINQRMVKNGSEIMVKDLKTGKVEKMSNLPAQFTGGAPSVGAALFDKASYKAPVSLGNEKYRVSGILTSDSIMSAQNWVYDGKLNQIVEIEQTLRQGGSVKTVLAYQKLNGKWVPKSIKMVTTMESIQSNITMEYLTYSTPAHINDAFFTME